LEALPGFDDCHASFNELAHEVQPDRRLGEAH
jgi:hypothetical protein